MRRLVFLLCALCLAFAAPAIAAPTIYGPTVASSNTGVTTRALSVTFTVNQPLVAVILNSNTSASISGVANATINCSETSTTAWFTASINFNSGGSRMGYGYCTPTSAGTENATVTWTNQSGSKSFTIVDFAAGTGTVTVNTNTVTAGQPTITSGTLASGDIYYLEALGISANTDTYTDDAAFTQLAGATTVSQVTRVWNTYKNISVGGAVTYTGSNSNATRNWGLSGFQFVPTPTPSGAGFLLRGVN